MLVERAGLEATWPAEVLASARTHFAGQELLNTITVPPGPAGDPDFRLLHRILTTTDLRMPALWATGSSADVQAAVRRAAAGPGRGDWRVPYHQALAAVAERDLAAAADLMAASFEIRPNQGRALLNLLAQATGVDLRG
jgi:hypothetical protein